MIQLYAKGTQDFSKNGISLRPSESTVTFKDNGQYDLEIVIPAQSKYTDFEYGQILRATVPTQNVAAVNLGTVSYYQVSNAEGTKVYSEIPTIRTVSYKPWNGGGATGQPEYSVGDRVSYSGKNYRCDNWDSSSPQVFAPPSNNSWWTEIPRTTGSSGKVAATLEQGDIVMKTADFNDTYVEGATLDGKSGYIKIADIMATGETEQRTVPARTITEQSFTITKIEKDQDNLSIRIMAEHVSYQLGRTMLGECNVVGVTPATALMFIQGAMQEAYSGNLYTDITETAITADWSWKNAQAAVLDPKNGLLGQAGGWMIRDDLDVFILAQGTPAPKYAVRYGANMKTVKWTGNVGDIVTRIYPIAKTEDGSTLLLPEKYIDTVRTVPFIRPEPLDTKLKVGDTVKNSDGTETTLTTDEVYRRMRSMANERFTIDKCDQAEVNLELDWAHMPDTAEYAEYRNLVNAAPGDWVEVKNGPLGISELIRMTGYSWDPMLCKYKNAKFGPNKEKATVAGYNLQNGSVTARALAQNSVGGSAIMAGTITAREIEANSLTADLIASKSIITELIAAGAITADEILANAITAEKIAAAAVTADKILAGAVSAEKIAANAVTADKILAGAVTAVKIAANAVTTEKLDAGAVTAAKIAAGAIDADKISAGAIDAINAKLGTATITNGLIDNANISYARIMDASVESLIAKDAVTDTYFIDKLQVRNAQMVYATIGELVIKATDNKYYRLDIAADGSVSPTEVTLTAAEIAAGETSDGHAAIIETDLTVADLSASNMKAINALIDKLTASRIDVGELWARQAFINQLMVTDISSNSYIQSTIGNWASQSTITQTINGLDSRISSLGYGTIYMQPEEPNHGELVSGDMWVQTLPSGSWEDIYNDYNSWEEIYNTFDAWQVIGSTPKVYVWDGQGWQELYDANIASTLETEIEQLANQITLLATKTQVNELEGDVSAFAATLAIQAEQIEQAVSAVNTKASTYVMYFDPRTLYTVTLGDIWIKQPQGADTWEDIYDNNDSWEEVYNTYDAWKDFIGDETYVWDGSKWVLTSDRAEQINQSTVITETASAVTVLAETTATLQGEQLNLSAMLIVANDRIAQEVARATTAEGGKIDKTSQLQTADAIVQQAVSEAATSASATYLAKTTAYQSADAIVSEAVRQAGQLAANGYIQKTTAYQDAASIVSAAERYTNGQLQNYSTSTQTSEEISSYVGQHAYNKVSGIGITAAGVDISGSQYVKIASGGYLQVTTGTFGIDTNNANYVMWAGANNAANSYFRVKKNGEVTLTKLLILDAEGTEAEFNLRTGGLWKLAYKTVRSTSSSGGYCTSMTFSDGTSVNFKHAVTAHLVGSWGGREYTVYADNDPNVLSVSSGAVHATYYQDSGDKAISALVYTSAAQIGYDTIDCTTIYNKGWKAAATASSSSRTNNKVTVTIPSQTPGTPTTKVYEAVATGIWSASQSMIYQGQEWYRGISASAYITWSVS